MFPRWKIVTHDDWRFVCINIRFWSGETGLRLCKHIDEKRCKKSSTKNWFRKIQRLKDENTKV